MKLLAITEFGVELVDFLLLRCYQLFSLNRLELFLLNTSLETLHLVFLVSDDLSIVSHLIFKFLSEGAHEGTKHLVAILFNQESPLQILLLFVKHREFFISRSESLLVLTNTRLQLVDSCLFLSHKSLTLGRLHLLFVDTCLQGLHLRLLLLYDLRVLGKLALQVLDIFFELYVLADS